MSRSPDMPYMRSLRNGAESTQDRQVLERIWAHDQWFDTPRQIQAAQTIASQLSEAGLADVQVFSLPADGRTRFQDWTSRLAWDCPAARLVDDMHTFADRQSVPQSIVQWSAPLEPTHAPVVDVDASGNLSPGALRGRFALTNRSILETKRRLIDSGVLAVISDAPAISGDPAATAWCNAWSDHPDGWHFTAEDQPLTGFCLSPEVGRGLRRRLAEKPNLKLHGFCQSQLYPGQSLAVTGRIPGRETGEIWLYCHAFETGANDNASGVTALLRAARMIQGLIRRKHLPPPRYSIRLLIPEECIGTLALLTQYPRLSQSALAGFNLDTCGDVAAERSIRLQFGPMSNPGFGWLLAGAIGQMLGEADPDYPVRFESHVPTGDDLIADPMCGVSSVQLGRGKQALHYHSSKDTPTICENRAITTSALFAATWAATLAWAEPAVLRQWLPRCQQWADHHLLIADKPDSHPDANTLRAWAAQQAFADLDRHWPTTASRSAIREPAIDPFPHAGDGPGLRRRVWGPMTLVDLAPGRSSGLSRWSPWQTAATYWVDGRRSATGLRRLVCAEVGELDESLFDRWLACGAAAGLLG